MEIVQQQEQQGLGVCYLCNKNPRGLTFNDGDCCGPCFDDLVMKRNNCTCNPVVDKEAEEVYCFCIGISDDEDEFEEYEERDQNRMCYICNIRKVVEPVRVCYYISGDERCCDVCYDNIVIKIGIYDVWNKFMPNEVPLRIEMFGTKGRGCVAERMFVPGDIVLVEKPILMEFSTWNLVESFLSKEFRISEIERFMKEFPGNGCGILRWDPRDAHHINVLSIEYPQINKDFIIKLYDSFSTYVVTLTRNNTGKYIQGIFNYINYINHACVPNCDMRTLDTNTGMTVLIANRIIMPGEEVTYSYVDMDTYRDLCIVAGPVRSKKLFDDHMKELFGFSCGCPI